MFFFRASDMTALVAQHLPELAAGVDEDRRGRGTRARARGPEGDLPDAPERLDRRTASWRRRRASRSSPATSAGTTSGAGSPRGSSARRTRPATRSPPGAIAIDAKNNLVRTLGTSKKVVALVGVNDLVVVETEDAILVIPRERAQDVRLVVDALKAAKRNELL